MASSEDICKIEHNYVDNYNNDNDKRCAPSKNYQDESCIPLDLLILLADAYNKSKGNMIIKINDKYMKCPSKYKKYLLIKLSKELTQCNDQKCWTTQDFARHINRDKFEELTENTFRPEGPQGKFEWLSTLNINDVMKQYEYKYKDFKFLEAVPMDFAQLGYNGFTKNELLELYNRNITKIGVIFNLDNHNQSGSHWVSLFCDFNNNSIYFSDSVGKKPHKNVIDYINILKQVCLVVNKNKNNVNVEINKMHHQKGSSECGVYSLNFIIRMLDGGTFEEFHQKRISDGEINKFRNVYFTDK